MSIIICSIDAGKFERVCANYRRLFASTPIEIIGIHDARSLAEGYNRGIARARAPQIIVSHDDIEILNDDFAARVGRHLERFDLIGIAGTTRLIEGRWAGAGDPWVYTLITSPFPDAKGYATVMMGGGALVAAGIQALDGVFMAMRSEVAQATPFDSDTFDGFHHYDLDFSLRAFQGGFRLAVCRDLVLIHESTGRYDPVWEEYNRRFEAKHRAHFPASWDAREGARATFSAVTRDEVAKRCAPGELARVAAEIGRANAGLDR